MVAGPTYLHNVLSSPIACLLDPFAFPRATLTDTHSHIVHKQFVKLEIIIPFLPVGHQLRCYNISLNCGTYYFIYVKFLEKVRGK